MHVEIIVRDAQKQLGAIGVQTFEGDTVCAQVVIYDCYPNSPPTTESGERRIAMPLDSTEIDSLISALQVARKQLRKVGA